MTPTTTAANDGTGPRSPDQLRQLASWYRAFAERAGNPAIWEGRLRLAGDLDAEADRLEGAIGGRRTPRRPGK